MKRFVLLFIPLILFGQQKDLPYKSTLRKSPIFEYKFFDGNRINCTIASDGPFADYRRTGGSGLEWPKGSGKYAIFTAGIWLAGKHRPTGEIRVSNMDYNTEYQPGPLLEIFNTTTNNDALPASRAGSPEYRLYKINVTDTLGSGNIDYDEWPGHLGAPFEDVNDNGVWDIGIDKPRMFGNQQLWSVINDVNNPRHLSLSLSKPLGVEIQSLYFGVSNIGPLGDVLFMKWRVINKSDADYDSVFISMFSDPDLGDANDDLPGSDSLLNLAYVYNGDNSDGGLSGYGSEPPAAGFVFLQGPLVPGSPSDSGLFDGKWRHGFNNLSPSSVVAYFNNLMTLQDPPDMTAQYIPSAYEFMNGMNGTLHQHILRPDNSVMRWWFSGDPVAGTGDLPSNFPLSVIIPQDIRLMINTGPFTLAVGDTQEVVGAFVIAQGADRLASVTKLKNVVRDQLLPFYTGSKPIASVNPVDSTYTVGDTVRLEGESIYPGGVIAETEWLVLERPMGSIAAPSPVSGENAQFIPDSTGGYTLGYRVVSEGGGADTSVVSFRAVKNRKPVVLFDSPATLILGDSLRLTTDGVSDPDGDPLDVSWNIEGGFFAPYVVYSPQDTVPHKFRDSLTAGIFTPLRTSLYSITLTARDQDFEVKHQRWMYVTPRLSENIQLYNNWPRPFTAPEASVYGYSAFRNFAGSVWQNIGGALIKFNFNSMSAPSEKYFYVTFGNFAVHENKIFVAAGRYGVDAFTTNPPNLITGYYTLDPDGPQVPSMTTADTSVADVFYQNPYLYFSYGLKGLYVYYWANVATTPMFVTNISNGHRWSTFYVEGSTLTAYHLPTHSLSTVGLANPAAPQLLGTLVLPIAYAGVRQFGYHQVAWTSDTLDITTFKLSGPPDMARVQIPKNINPFNRIIEVSYYNKRVAVGTLEGTYVYDIWDPINPKLAGYAITGSPHQRLYMDSERMLAVNWNWQNVNNPGALEGLLNLTPIATNIEKNNNSIPTQFALKQNYPNPFNPTTEIEFDVPEKGRAKLLVYDVTGREVATLLNKELAPGTYKATFDASRLSSGVYFYRLTVGNYSAVKKMMLIR